MGKPQSQNPFATDEAVRPAQRPETSPETRGRGASLEDYRNKAEKVESDPNKEAAEAIRQLRGSKKIEEQEKGLAALNQAITSVLVKLIKKDVDISKITSTEKLKREIVINAVQLSLVEATAVENLDRIVREPGETSTELKNSWPERIEAAIEGSKGWSGKAKEYFLKNPLGSIALLIAGASAAVLGYEAVKNVSANWGAGDKDPKATWFKKEIAVPAVLLVAGGILGKDVVAQMLGDAGLDFLKVQDKVQKGKEFTEDEKRRLEEAGRRVQERVEQQRTNGQQPAAAPTTGGTGGAPATPTEVTPTYGQPVPPAETDHWGEEEETPAPAEPEKPKAAPLEINEELGEMAKYTGPRDLLVYSYIRVAGGAKKFETIDVGQIQRSIDVFKDKKISEVLAYWEKIKNNKPKKAPKQNDLGKFDDDITEENIFMAVEIVAQSAEEYKKVSKKEDISDISLEEFFEKHVNKDRAKKVSAAVEKALIATIEENDLTELDKLNDIKLDEIEQELKNMETEGREELITEFGIDMNGVNKKQFLELVAILELYGDLYQADPEDAFRRIAKFPKSTDPKTREAVKTFYSKIRERTIQQIVPAAVDRFNLDKTIVNNPKNADILKDELDQSKKPLMFRRAFYLCLVTKSIDLSKRPPKEALSGAQELAFLFTVLGSISEAGRQRYISELAAASTDELDKLPSLAVLKPYISMVGNFAISQVQKRVRGWGYMLSSIMPNRTDEDQAEFLRSMREKPMLSWGFLADGAKEASGGGIEIAVELITPLIESGKVTLEEIRHASEDENAGLSIMQLIRKAGGTFLFGKDERGEPYGIVHFMGDVFVCRPGRILLESLLSCADGDFSGALKIWTVGSAPFVSYGFVSGALKAYWSYGGWMKGRVLLHGLWGGLKMQGLYPYYALRASVRAAGHAVSTVVTAPTAAAEYAWRRPVGTAKRVGRGTADIFRYRSPWPGQNVPNMLDNAKWFEHYAEGSSEITKLSIKEKWHYLRRDPKVLVTRLAESFNTSMSLRYASRFAKDYNDFFDFDAASSQRINWMAVKEGNMQELGKVKDRIGRVRAFLEAADTYDSIFDDMRAATRAGLQGDKLQTTIANLIGKMNDKLSAAERLHSDEIKSLAKQLLSEKDVTNLQNRMKMGLQAIKREAELAAEAAKTSKEPGRMRKLLDRVRGKKSDTGTQPAEPAGPDSSKAPAEPEPAKPKNVPEAGEPKRLKNGKYSYGGEEFEISKNDIKKMKKARNLKTDQQAIEAICDERWNTIRNRATAPDGGRVVRYRGVDITLTKDECATRATIESNVKAKYQVLASGEPGAPTTSAPAKAPTAEPGAAEPGAGTEPPKVTETPESAARSSRWKNLKENLKRSLYGETLAQAGGSEKALAATNKDFTALQKEIEAAENAMKEIDNARKATNITAEELAKLEAEYRSASEVIGEGRQLQISIETTRDALQNVKNLQDAVKRAKTAKDLVKLKQLKSELNLAVTAAEEAMKGTRLAMESAGKASKAWRVVKVGGRVLGTTLAAGGAVISAVSAISSFHEAITTNVEGRSAVKWGEGAMWSLNAVADGCAVAAMFGAEGAAVGIGEYAAGPLAPLTIAGAKVFETLYEDTKTSAEWIQGNPHQILNYFYTSINTCSIGEGWIASMGLFMTEKGQKEYDESRRTTQRETMRKIFRALVAMQKDPSILELVYDSKMSADEKDKKLTERIDKTCSIYHEYYFENAMLTGVQTYADAQRFILEAQMFDHIMTKRDEFRKEKKPFILMNKEKEVYNLDQDRYSLSFTGATKPGENRVKAQVNYQPQHIVQAYKDTVNRLFERDPIRKSNLDRMDNSYLIRLYYQISLNLNDPQVKADEDVANTLKAHAEQISGYLKMVRSVNLTMLMIDPSQDSTYREPKMSLEEIAKHLEGIGTVSNQVYLDYEKANYKKTPALQAMYRMAEYFGYAGVPTEEGLKAFFSQDSAPYHGIYWNGSEWMLQERGYESDDSFGPTLNNEMIEKMIVRMKEQPDNILEHHSDSILMDSRDYTNEVMKMAGVMEQGLAEGKQRHYQGGGAEGKRESEFAVNYRQSKENLTKSYEDTIEFIKKETGWSQLKYEIENENSVIISRADGGAQVKITRTGEAWKVGEYKDGLTFMQAVTLANLKNWAQLWLERGGIKGGSDRPFEVDGNTIDFDASGTVIDTNFIEKMLGFYSEIGISKEMAVDMLNNWFEKDGSKIKPPVRREPNISPVTRYRR